MNGRENSLNKDKQLLKTEKKLLCEQRNNNDGSFTWNFLIITGGLIILIPFLWGFLTSFKSNVEAYAIPIQWIPKVWRWWNYKTAFTVQPLTKFFINSVITAVVTTTSSLLLSAMAAYAFAKIEFKGKTILFYLWMGTMSIPVVITLIPSFILMQQFNWVDKLASLIVPFMGGSISGIFLLRQFMATIPNDIEEAAFLDGCSRLRIFFQIILPLTRPALLTLGVFLFNTSWNNFIWPLLMIREKTNATLPLGLSYYMPSGETDMGKNFDWGVLMAATVMAVLPTIFIYIIVQKQFTKGITLSGLKS